MAAAITVRELLREGQRRLDGLQSARLDAELLLACSMGSGRSRLYAYPEKQVPPAAVEKFHALLEKRLARHPVAYLTGRKEFWSMDLLVDAGTLIPRPETECLVETALTRIPAGGKVSVLDLGTGSGAIALAIARERPAADIVAVDCSGAALAVAGANARRLGLERVTFLKSDWFSALGARRFDIIVCNPPYVSTGESGILDAELRHEPRQALDGGPGGMQAYTQLVPAVPRFLVPGGHLFLEHGHRQGKALRGLLTARGYRDILGGKDYAGLERISQARWT